MKFLLSTLSAILAVVTQLQAACAENSSMVKIGNFTPDTRPNIPNYISICGWQSVGTVKIKVEGSESFARSSCPDVWFLKESTITPAYTYKTMGGLQIRFTGFNFKPCVDPDIHIYYGGKFWKVSRELLKPIFESKDKSQLAEIKDGAIWFNQKQLGKLPEQGLDGTWYPTVDLEVVLAENFHDTLNLHFVDNCEGSLTQWNGRELHVHTDNQSKVTLADVSSGNIYVFTGGASTLDIDSIDCDKLDACAQKNSIISIKSGHIVKANVSRIFGGQIQISAKTDSFGDRSQGIPNSQPIIKKKRLQRGRFWNFPKMEILN